MRLDAEKLLRAEGNKHGAFLIRHCESQAGELSLSGTHNADTCACKDASTMPSVYCLSLWAGVR
uniref:SH2 domain-containing protein n=1 Tax=Astyanax mexicanus TaxID=7994 RepID=A0A8B9H9X2_ASTMX